MNYSFTTCQMCQHEFSATDSNLIPRNLFCGHAFCTSCLNLQLHQSIIKCPFNCAVETPVLGNSVLNLPIAHAVLNMLDHMQFSLSNSMNQRTMSTSQPSPQMQYPTIHEYEEAIRSSAIASATAAKGVASSRNSLTGSSGSHSLTSPKHIKTLNFDPQVGSTFYVIKDQYETIESVQRGLQKAGLESSNLIISVDFTKSNAWSGTLSFGGKCLHALDPTGVTLNPYQAVMSVIGRTLEIFDDDRLIPAFGFGDLTTTDKSCFPFNPDGKLCQGVQEVLDRYSEIVPDVVLSGPTNFAPVIREAMKIVAQTGQYHILLIIADGQVTRRRDTEQAIVDASALPLSIIFVGIGDGPFETVSEMDDGLPERCFDNFQFVNYAEVAAANPPNKLDTAFAVSALMEIPDQFKCIKALGYLER